MDPKNYQNYTWINLCSLLPIKKFWSQIPIRPSLWLQILPNHSQRYDSSTEMLRFVNIVRDKTCETLSIFYHSLHIWYHHIMTNLVIFKLRLLFLEFKNHSTTRSWSCFLNEMFGIFFISKVRPHTRLNNMTIIFLLILFYYLNHLQFKLDLNQKISWNAIN